MIAFSNRAFFPSFSAHARPPYAVAACSLTQSMSQPCSHSVLPENEQTEPPLVGAVEDILTGRDFLHRAAIVGGMALFFSGALWLSGRLSLLIAF